jgi:hypothetical protein
VVAANMRSWPVLTQPRGPTGRRPKGALNSAQTGESAAEYATTRNKLASSAE